MEYNSIIIPLCILCIQNVLSGKILTLHPMTAPSHTRALRSLAVNLVEKGHQVRMVRWLEEFEIKKLSVNGLEETVLAVNNSDGKAPLYTHEERAKFTFPHNLAWTDGTNPASLPLKGFAASMKFCDSLLSKKEFIESLQKEQFDVAIVDLLYNECSLALAHHLGLPTIGYWAFPVSVGESQYTTARNSPSMVPCMMSHNSAVMTFWERFNNYYIYFASHIVMQIQFYLTGISIQKWLPNSPSGADLLANLSGVMIDTHPAIEYPRLLPPSFVEVGGFHIQEKKDKLPKDLLDFVNSAEHGVILFSLGSSFNFDFVPKEVLNRFINAFGRLKYKIIMKVNGASPKLPENILVMKWFPQISILAHNKTKLFITHCGLHGIVESLTYGVPMIGIPIFGDQKDNFVRLKDLGVAAEIDKNTDEHFIFDQIMEVINNPSYRKNAKRVSNIINSDVISPREKAISFVELVMKTQGAEHLKMSSRHLNFIQYYGLDVFLISICIVFILVWMSNFLFNRVFRIFRISESANNSNRFKLKAT